MKLVKRIFLSVLFILNVVYGYSQYSLLPEVNVLKTDYGANVGLGGKFETILYDRFSAGFGGNYYFPITFYRETEVIAKDPNTTPNKLTLNVEREMSLSNIYLQFRTYFVGDSKDEYGIYGILEGGALYVELRDKIDNYDSDLYELEYDNGGIEKLWFSSIVLGLGVEKDLGFGYIYGAAKVHILTDINDVDSMFFDESLPFSVNAGIRFPIDFY